eukprot:CAMPEP_0116866206 /NCGR_PEP_ID=MMETSP0418-20121206/25897_1 /TAXON_ID=1158023 /ORGANISM="Astrosyne radiata, Strain 13vi08-1A" /LENGTH=143 /DNA_ID=CAMNT_0004501809 /DNA_START=995 /DNA_END=1427 /DNA_ORIENTATION=-
MANSQPPPKRRIHSRPRQWVFGYHVRDRPIGQTCPAFEVSAYDRSDISAVPAPAAKALGEPVSTRQPISSLSLRALDAWIKSSNKASHKALRAFGRFNVINPILVVVVLANMTFDFDILIRILEISTTNLMETTNAASCIMWK